MKNGILGIVIDRGSGHKRYDAGVVPMIERCQLVFSLASLVVDRDVDITEQRHYERTAAGTPWGVQVVPLYNYANKQIGVVALSMSFAADKRDANRARVWLSLTTVLGILVMVGMVLIVIRGLLLRPLLEINRRFEALASGDASQPAPDADGMVLELRMLAHNYERLRQGRGA